MEVKEIVDQGQLLSDIKERLDLDDSDITTLDEVRQISHMHSSAISQHMQMLRARQSHRELKDPSKPHFGPNKQKPSRIVWIRGYGPNIPSTTVFRIAL